MARFPARLHVLLARDASTALVIRRGPARSVATIGWDRKRDTFELGQWLRGRIYEMRCDLSPDGTHFIYFAMNGHWKSRGKGAWTAISRPPYLTAVALHAKGDCWNGGGLFLDNRTYWLNGPHEMIEDTGEVNAGARSSSFHYGGGECHGVYFNRLERDGWTIRPELSIHTRLAGTTIWDKPIGHGWTLRRFAHGMVGQPVGKSVYYDEHELVGDGRELPRHDWEWTDLDGKRLVWATGGALYAGHITAKSAKQDDPIERVTQLHDFNAMQFEAIAAPYPRRGRKR